MGKNLIPLIAEMLGVKIGEKFTIRQNEYIFEDYTAVFDKDKGLIHVLTDGNLENDNASLYAVLSGEVEIVKLPWEPKYEEQFYTYIHNEAHNEWLVDWFYWHGTPFQLALKQLGMVFKTREDAEKALPELYEKLTGKKWEVNGKLPWEPQEGDRYYVLNTNALFIESFIWDNSTFGYAAKDMGIIYRTKAEAEAHLEEDYKRLTGKPLGSY